MKLLCCLKIGIFKQMLNIKDFKLNSYMLTEILLESNAEDRQKLKNIYIRSIIQEKI